MRITVSKQKLRLLYAQAEANYARCIADEDNKHLQAEAGVPLDAIIARGITVKFGFAAEAAGAYTTEVHLALCVGDEEIGKYVYYEDNTGAEMEDSLVLYSKVASEKHPK